MGPNYGEHFEHHNNSDVMIRLFQNVKKKKYIYILFFYF